SFRGTLGTRTEQQLLLIYPMAPACSPELLHRASRIARLLDEEGDAVLPVHCWRTLLRELDVPEDSEAANFLMDYVEPCSQGHFTFEPLLAAAARFDGGADYGPDYGPEDGDAGYGYADAGYGHADAGYGHAGDVTTDHQAAPRVPALDLGKAQRAQDRPGAGPNSGGALSFKLRCFAAVGYLKKAGAKAGLRTEGLQPLIWRAKCVGFFVICECEGNWCQLERQTPRVFAFAKR
ncbi:unnamed protein product, partial [Effrenium voratum]